MTKDPEYKNWNPELIRRHKEYKRKQQEIRDYHADLMEQHKEQYREKQAGILARQKQHYPENRPWPGAPTLFPGEGSLTSDGLNSLQTTCDSCGNILNKTAKFCAKCGTRID